MKMALKGNTLILVEVDNVQFAIIKSWNKMKWDKKSQTLHGFADIELLDKLASIVRLPSTVEQRRRKLYAIQEAALQSSGKGGKHGHPDLRLDYPKGR